MFAERDAEEALARFTQGQLRYPRLIRVPWATARLAELERLRAAEYLVFVGAGGVERLQCLAAGAPRGEGWERAAHRLPGGDRAEQPKPSLLGDIASVATARQAKPRHERADERLVAAQELLQSSTVVVLRCTKQSVFVR